MTDARDPFSPLTDDATVRAWLRVASSGPLAHELSTLYAELAQAVAHRAPVCNTSGRCCHFEAWGHRLYVTGVEAAYAWARLEADRRPTPAAVSAALQRGGCPFQPQLLCTIHLIRPLGCRIFFCDESATRWQEETYERFQSRLREMHDRAGLAYLYAEWRALLGLFSESDVAAAWPTVTVTAGSSGEASAAPGTPRSGASTGITIEGREPLRRSDEPI